MKINNLYTLPFEQVTLLTSGALQVLNFGPMTPNLPRWKT